MGLTGNVNVKIQQNSFEFADLVNDRSRIPYLHGNIIRRKKLFEEAMRRRRFHEKRGQSRSGRFILRIRTLRMLRERYEQVKGHTS